MLLVIWHGNTPAELRRRASQKKYSGLQKQILSVAYAMDAIPAREVAERLGCSESSVRLWVQRYNEHGLIGLQHKKKSVHAPSRRVPKHPYKLSREQFEQLKSLVHDFVAGANRIPYGVEIQEIVKREFNVHCETETCRNWRPALVADCDY